MEKKNNEVAEILCNLVSSSFPLFSFGFFPLNSAPLSHLVAFMSVFHEQTIETTVYF